ncbi:MAG TPA: MFS transporter [Ktedonobacterales bacterium]|nr:MFS transporter [Ktedonobacterales bacterium]
MPPTPYSGHTSSGPHSAAADAPDARLDARRLRSLIVISFSASVAFTAMYSTQPILPQIGQEFHVSPAEAGLTLLAVTFALAVASLGAGRMADAIGTRRMMLICGTLLSVFSVAAPLAPTFASLVALRVAQGLAVPGITIAGLAYLHNELPPAWRGRVSGFYIAANTLGGLLGRLMVGLTVETLGWRGGLALIAGWVVLGTLALAIAPATRRRPETTSQSTARGARPPSLTVIIRKLWWAPLIGGTIFLPFLTVFSFAPYRLEGPPFLLSPTLASLIYLVYLLGAVASPIAGNISDRVGRRPTIQVSLAITFVGLACTLVDMLPLILLGLALVCIGSLMAHVVANASVSDAANPLGAQARATALALYTLGFYVGGGIGSFVPGLALVAFGWNGVIALCVVAVVGAFLCSLVTSAHPERGAYVEPTATAG